MANNPFDPQIVQVKKTLNRSGLATVNRGYGSLKSSTLKTRQAPPAEQPDWWPESLSELSDVDTVTVPPTNGQVLVYNIITGMWEPGDQSGGGGGSDPATLVLPNVTTWTKDYPDGVFNVLGRVFGGGIFANPAGSGSGLFVNAEQMVVATQSSNLDATRTADKALDHSLDSNVGSTHTGNVADSWWQVDFTANRLFQPTRLAIVGRASAGQHPRNFKLQGSDDTVTWTDLLTVSSEGPNDNSWWSKEVVGSAFYRYLRILQTGLNSSGANYLVLGEVEMWGILKSA